MIRTTKENSVAIEIVKEPRKFCRNKVDKLKRKMLVAKKKIISRQFPEAEVYKELGETNFVSRHKTSPVTTRTRLLHQNSIATLSKSIKTESKKKLRESVLTKNYMLQQKPTTKTKDSVATELSLSR